MIGILLLLISFLQPFMLHLLENGKNICEYQCTFYVFGTIIAKQKRGRTLLVFFTAG
jgi:hypothetical protein